MRPRLTFPLCLFMGISALVAAADVQSQVDAMVAKLRSPDATSEDWRPILEAGKAAVPQLQKLLTDPHDTVRASAAVLLYRLGEASALDTLAALLDSKDEDARKEAQDALLAFLGQPVAADAGAPPEQRAEAVRQWRAWWKAERDNALKIPPMTVLNGRIVTTDTAAGLVVTTLAGKHGGKRGMQLNVHRGDRFVCLLRIAMADAKGSVAQIVPLSERTPPAVGDAFFWAEPKPGDASAPQK